MDPMRPDAAHLVTVFGSTRNIRATSPGVSSCSWMSVATEDLLSGPRPLSRPGDDAHSATSLCRGAHPNYAFMSESERSVHRPIPRSVTMPTKWP